MARGIATIETCSVTPEGQGIIGFCVVVLPEAGETFPAAEHHLQYITDGTQTPTQLNNGIQAEAIYQMSLLGITLTGAKFVQNKFT